MIKGEANPVYYKGYEEGKQQTLKDELEWLNVFNKLRGMTSVVKCVIVNRINEIEKELGDKKNDS